MWPTFHHIVMFCNGMTANRMSEAAKVLQEVFAQAAQVHTVLYPSRPVHHQWTPRVSSQGTLLK